MDTNGDGVYGSTEPGLGGVPILLSGMTYSGATYSRVQTSAASSGLVSFITVPPGVYTVRLEKLPLVVIWRSAHPSLSQLQASQPMLRACKICSNGE